MGSVELFYGAGARSVVYWDRLRSGRVFWKIYLLLSRIPDSGDHSKELVEELLQQWSE